MELENIIALVIVGIVLAVTFYESVIKKPSGKRAKGPLGRFLADDKSTKYKNEAYADGKSPKKKK
tara:strand:+ start:289 stop:483 length:195 start_codon:yes stop_codon:yes gene_type:complete